MLTQHNDRKRFDVAKNWKIRFGKFKGQTLNQAAESDEGLTYLDWMLGLDDLHDDFRSNLETFLGYGPVARDLDVAIAHKCSSGRQSQPPKSTPPWK